MLGLNEANAKLGYAETCRPDPEKMLQRARAEKDRAIALKVALLNAARNIHVSMPSGGENYFVAIVGTLELKIYEADCDIARWLAEIDKP